MTRIVIVDDHPLVRQGMRDVIERCADCAVVGEASTVPAAQDLVTTLAPDLAIVDLALAGGHGLDLVRWLTQTHPGCRALVVSMHDEGIYAERALRLGAHGYLMKDQAVEELGTAVERVAGGRTYLSQAMTERLLNQARGHATRSPRAALDELTPRELQVLELLGRGRGTAEIARDLCVGVKTVETYRLRLKDKLDLPDAPALVRYAVAWVLEM